MRELENANVLHKSDSDYNKDEVNIIRAAKRAKNPRDLIDFLSGIKNWQEIEEKIEWSIESSIDTNAWNLDTNTFSNAIENTQDKNIREEER